MAASALVGRSSASQGSDDGLGGLRGAGSRRLGTPRGAAAVAHMRPFAANLRRLRPAKGISQEDLAYEAGINRTYLSKLEKGASYPGLEIIATVAVLEVGCWP